MGYNSNSKGLEETGVDPAGMKKPTRRNVSSFQADAESAETFLS